MTIMGTNCHCRMHYSFLDLKEHHSHELSEFCQDSKLSICIVIIQSDCVLSVHVNNAQQGKKYLNKMFSMKQNDNKNCVNFCVFSIF